MSWAYFLLLIPAAFLVLLAGPALFGRLFMPRLTLALVRRFGGLAASLMDRVSPGLDLRLLARAGNRYFHKSFINTPYDQRILFLPFCLRPLDCPSEVDPDQGLLCDSSCPGCELGRLRQEALDLGYAKVYIVPSSRMMRDRGLLPSDEFLTAKIKEDAPAALLGVVCDWYLRHRLIANYSVGSKGFSPEGGRPDVAIQGVLFERNCKKATADWDLVRQFIQLGPGSPPDQRPPRARYQGRREELTKKEGC